jgi:hypothetical protein
MRSIGRLCVPPSPPHIPNSYGFIPIFLLLLSLMLFSQVLYSYPLIILFLVSFLLFSFCYVYSFLSSPFSYSHFIRFAVLSFLPHLLFNLSSSYSFLRYLPSLSPPVLNLFHFASPGLALFLPSFMSSFLLVLPTSSPPLRRLYRNMFNYRAFCSSFFVVANTLSL